MAQRGEKLVVGLRYPGISCRHTIYVIALRGPRKQNKRIA
jgi:hypothetical protein